LRRDREKALINKAKEMEKAFATGNMRLLFSLSRNSSRSNIVSETICEKDGTLIRNQDRRIDRWAEHFSEQFSWPNTDLPNVADMTVRTAYAISDEAPTRDEISTELRCLKSNKASGPDNLSPELFKEGGETICLALAELFKKIWDSVDIPKEWCRSTIIPLFKKGVKTSCDNHRGISLVSIASKILTGLIRRRLLISRESQTREEQAGFRPHRDCIDHIFTLRQIMQQRKIYKQPTILVFLDLKSAFDSVCREALWHCLLKYGVPPKFVNILRSLYSNSESRVSVYGKQSKPFTTTSGVRQGCPISPFLFNFVIDDILTNALKDTQNFGVELIPGPNLTDIEYADDIVLLGKSEGVMQDFLHRLRSAAESYGMCFAPKKCKVMLQNWVGQNPNLNLANCSLEIVTNFSYLGANISSTCDATDDIDSRIIKARIAFKNFGHIWRQGR
jgi:hypothetical protein